MNKPLRQTIAAKEAKDEAAPAEAGIDFKLLTESTSDVIIRCGLDGIVSYCSPAIRQLLGIAPEELIGKSHRDLVHPEDMPALQSTAEGFRAGKTFGAATYRMRRSDGSLVWVEGRGRRIPGATPGESDLVIVQRDITERKILEAKLSMLALTASDRQPADEPPAEQDVVTGKSRMRRPRTIRSVN